MMVELAPTRHFLHYHDHLTQSAEHAHVVVDRADWELARRILLTTDQADIDKTRDSVAQNRPLTSGHKTYDFRAILDDGTIIDDKIANALLEAGCDDGTITTAGNRAWIRFSREGESLETAIKSAVCDIQKANCCTVVRIELDADLS